MPLSPLQSEVYVEQLASNILVAALGPDEIFVHDRIFATVPVQRPSGLYFKYPTDQWFRSSAKVTGPSAESPTTEYHIGQDRYDCEVMRLKTPISEDIAVMYQAPADAKRDSTALLARQMKIAKEIAFNNAYIQPGIWTGFNYKGIISDFDVSQTVQNGGYSQGQWQSPSSNPLLDLQLAQDTMQSMTGYKGGTLLVSKDVDSALKQHPVLIDRIKYTQAGFVTEELIARALGVAEYVVLESVVNSAQEGQIKQMGFMSRNCALLVYKEPAPAILRPSAGYCFSYVGDPRVGGLPGVVTSWYEPRIRSTMLEASTGFAFKMVASDFGIFFKNVLAV